MWIDSVVDVAFLPDGRLVTAGKHELAVWDLSTREKLWSSPEQFAVVAASPVGDVVIGASAEGYTSFDAESGARLDDRPLAAGDPLTAAAISTDGSTLAVGTSDGRLMVVELATNGVYTLDVDAEPHSAVRPRSSRSPSIPTDQELRTSAASDPRPFSGTSPTDARSVTLCTRLLTARPRAAVKQAVSRSRTARCGSPPGTSVRSTLRRVDRSVSRSTCRACSATASRSWRSPLPTTRHGWPAARLYC